MFVKLALSICFFLSLPGSSFAQANDEAIPKSAVVLEKRNVTARRGLVLWMPDPKKNPRDAGDDVYACPDETRGHYYTGIAKVSLIDRQTKKIVNTIEIQGHPLAANNVLDLPYLIRRGYYEVPRIDERREGKPVLMNLKDYNADGKPFEFALFDALACQGLPSTLIGYSPGRDRVVQYQTELKSAAGTAGEFWVDYFFGRRADRRGVWKYRVDYRGRAGTLDEYELRYDKNRELFYGTLVSVSDGRESPRK